jgi:hypothetical protein
MIRIKNTAFNEVMGEMDVFPLLGGASSFLFPLILVILIVFNACDIYKKILDSIGLK